MTSCTGILAATMRRRIDSYHPIREGSSSVVRKSGSRFGRRVRASIQATRTLASTNKPPPCLLRTAENPLRSQTDGWPRLQPPAHGRVTSSSSSFGAASVLDVQTQTTQNRTRLLNSNFICENPSDPTISSWLFRGAHVVPRVERMPPPSVSSSRLVNAHLERLTIVLESFRFGGIARGLELEVQVVARVNDASRDGPALRTLVDQNARRRPSSVPRSLADRGRAIAVAGRQCRASKRSILVMITCDRGCRTQDRPASLQTPLPPPQSCSLMLLALGPARSPRTLRINRLAIRGVPRRLCNALDSSVS